MLFCSFLQEGGEPGPSLSSRIAQGVAGPQRTPIALCHVCGSSAAEFIDTNELAWLIRYAISTPARFGSVVPTGTTHEVQIKRNDVRANATEERCRRTEDI